MLTTIKHYIENPDDVPAISQSASEYLKARLNVAYLSHSGELDSIRRQGFSEAALYGLIEGLNFATEVIEHMEMTQAQKFEDEQPNKE